MTPDALGETLRDTRSRLGLSQAALARAARVSLATVQNIEAGRANPALSTLSRVGEALGLAVGLAPTPVDWAALIALGLPLGGQPRRLAVRDADTLRRHVGRAAAELARTGGTPGDDRRRDALSALIVAADLHFPAVTARWLHVAPDVCALIPDPVPGRIIKLARLATRRLAEYL